MSDYPTDYYYSIISQQSNVKSLFQNYSNLTSSLFKQNALMVNVFYDDLYYTSIKESGEYSAYDMLGIIGILFVYLIFFIDVIKYFFLSE